MSASQDPIDLINQAEGRSIGQIIVNTIGGWFLGMGISLIAGFQTVFEFLFLPFDILIDIASASANAFLVNPFGLVDTGLEITSQEIEIFGILALPASVLMVLGTLFIVIMYLQLGTSSNILPGLFIDNRLVDFLFTSPEEEAEGED